MGANTAQRSHVMLFFGVIGQYGIDLLLTDLKHSTQFCHKMTVLAFAPSAPIQQYMVKCQFKKRIQARSTFHNITCSV